MGTDWRTLTESNETISAFNDLAKEVQRADLPMAVGPDTTPTLGRFDLCGASPLPFTPSPMLLEL